MRTFINKNRKKRKYIHHIRKAKQKGIKKEYKQIQTHVYHFPTQLVLILVAFGIILLLITQFFVNTQVNYLLPDLRFTPIQIDYREINYLWFQLSNILHNFYYIFNNVIIVLIKINISLNTQITTLLFKLLYDFIFISQSIYLWILNINASINKVLILEVIDVFESFQMLLQVSIKLLFELCLHMWEYIYSLGVLLVKLWINFVIALTHFIEIAWANFLLILFKLLYFLGTPLRTFEDFLSYIKPYTDVFFAHIQMTFDDLNMGFKHLKNIGTMLQ